MNKLIVKNIDNDDKNYGALEFDGWIPLKFQVNRNHGSVVYINLGDEKHSRLVLTLDCQDRTIRRVTLVSFIKCNQWPEIWEGVNDFGLPALTGDWDDESKEILEVMSIDNFSKFFVSHQKNHVLIWFGDISTLTRKITFFHAEFLIFENELRGIRFFDLTDKEMSEFLKLAPKAPENDPT